MVVLIDLEIGGTQIMLTGSSMTETIKEKKWSSKSVH